MNSPNENARLVNARLQALTAAATAIESDIVRAFEQAFAEAQSERDDLLGEARKGFAMFRDLHERGVLLGGPFAMALSSDELKARIAASALKLKQTTKQSPAVAVTPTASAQTQRSELDALGGRDSTLQEFIANAGNQSEQPVQQQPAPEKPQTQPAHGAIVSLTSEKPKKARTTRNALPDVQREPPHSVEAEQGVLGSMLQQHGGSEAIEEAMAKISHQHFYVPAHRTIFIALCDLFDSGQAVDFITFTQSLRDKKLLDSVGGAPFVTSLFTFVPTAAAIGYYIDIVRDKYVLRSIIATCTESVRRAYDEQVDVAETLSFANERFDAISLNGAIDDLPAPTSIVALAEKDPAVFDNDNVLGNRFLCREGIMLVVAPSDAGKSSCGMQQDICWSLGRVAFGIKPARALRMLTVQAENDDGDIAEMTRGICDHLGLSAAERALVRERVVYIKEKSLTGKAFLRRLRRLIRKYKPDIVRIDPLHAYAGGDVINPDVTRAFLRNGLNPILEEFQCAAIIMHHTPKTTNRDTSKWSASDWMYAAAGNADLTNCARAILVLDPTKILGTFLFLAAKRGRRIGWADENGDRVYDRVFCHNAGNAIFWRDATDDDIERVELAKSKKGEPLQTKEELKALVPLDEAMPKQALLSRAALKGFGINHAKRLLDVLIADHELHELHRPRKGTRAEVLIARREETLL